MFQQLLRHLTWVSFAGFGLLLGACNGSSNSGSTGASTNVQNSASSASASGSGGTVAVQSSGSASSSDQSSSSSSGSSSSNPVRSLADQLGHSLAPASQSQLNASLAVRNNGLVNPGAKSHAKVLQKLPANFLTNPADLTGQYRLYMPRQLRHAYGIDQVPIALHNFGAGETICIVDAFEQPFIQSDLEVFDQTFGLPPADFQVIDLANGNGWIDPDWSVEESLDVQQAHAIAPRASIILVEAVDNYSSSLLNAVDVCVESGASVVSMSWGLPFEVPPQNCDPFDPNCYPGDAYESYHFQVPNVAFVASSGDNGIDLFGFPANTPYTFSVGGTSINLDMYGNRIPQPGAPAGEAGWSDGVSIGSGGGLSQVFVQPDFQTGLKTYGARAVPDVALNAALDSAVPVFDSVDFYVGEPGWLLVGGTSVAAPEWAGILALANAGRSQKLSAVNIQDQNGNFIQASLMNMVYAIAEGAPSSFNDLVSGCPYFAFTPAPPLFYTGTLQNYFCAHSGYDYVTGLGTPNANVLIPYLQQF
jgi:subtilase family serine protease